MERLANLPIGNVLVVAPAGSGKTEALAHRARAIISRGQSLAPHMILALTFSNKARDSLANRMNDVVGPWWRRRISVTNFHGLAARILKAHGGTIGLRHDLLLPDEPWLRRQRMELGVDKTKVADFEAALRSAKSGVFDDSEVMTRLVASNNIEAIAYERRLRAEGMIDHDDLIRYAVRLLRNEAIARLYQIHFATVMVDEVQDLSLLQFEIVRAVGDDRITYAGDPAQGIYSFAGADPDTVFARILDLSPTIVRFATSYRSAPAVLNAVNGLAREMGSVELTCGDPAGWPDGGQVIYIETHDTRREAAVLIEMVKGVCRQSPAATIGIVSRGSYRLVALRLALQQAAMVFEDWGAPTHVPYVVELLQRRLREAIAIAPLPDAALTTLERLCRETLDPTDVATTNELLSACEELGELVANGITLTEAVGRCRVSKQPGLPVAPGLHLLTGHRGKGQQFDWVVVIGLEEGHVPDFRSADNPEELRVLHVMISRARYGLVFTYSRHRATFAGPRVTKPSRWLGILRATATESLVR